MRLTSFHKAGPIQVSIFFHTLEVFLTRPKVLIGTDREAIARVEHNAHGLVGTWHEK